MYISINWIKDFVNLDGIDIDSLIYNFTMSTAEVEGSVKYGYDTKGVVVGQIEKIENVADSTKLHKVLVNIGNEKIQSICGASNIFEGAKVPFAKVGAKLNGINVEKSLVNGLDSLGMCLSEKELGISDNHLGVMILDNDLNIGQDIKEIIPLEDTVFEIDNKSITNRPDLWGHYGIAREIAAITKRELKPLDVEDLNVYNDLPKLDIKVEECGSCLRYTGITVENVTKKVATNTMKTRLYYTGLRSINLLADITNYVMLEIGQPMHAFDKKYVKKIDVRSLKEDMNFVTLDNITRNLKKGTLMIQNQDGPIGIAGIMGGLNSEIKDDTNSLFLESATFDSTLIRKTATKISHRTDASTRYEKTLDPEFCKLATSRFIKLLKKIDENIQVTSSFTDVYLVKYPEITIDIDKNFFDRYIGIEIPMDIIIDTLERLKFKVTKKGDNLKVIVPSYRATKDVSVKADLIEEVARIYGYDNIEPKSNLWRVLPIKEDEIRVLEYESKKTLAEKYGASEIHTYVWYNEEQNRVLEIEVEDNLKVINSLSKGDNILRTTMGPSMLYAVDNNIKYSQDVKLFEIGRTFDYKFDNNNCNENKVLAIALASTKKTEEDLMFEAKSMIETIMKINKNINVKYTLNNNRLKYKWVHSINSYIIEINGNIQGHISVVHPKVVDNINKKANVVIVEFKIDNLDKFEKEKVIYKPITKYQTVNLDLTMIIDSNIKYEAVQSVIERANLEYLLKYELVDIYENKEKLAGKKSVTIRFNIGSHEKTLSKDEIDFEMNSLISEFDKNDMLINR